MGRATSRGLKWTYSPESEAYKERELTNWSRIGKLRNRNIKNNWKLQQMLNQKQKDKTCETEPKGPSKSIPEFGELS